MTRRRPGARWVGPMILTLALAASTGAAAQEPPPVGPAPVAPAPGTPVVSAPGPAGPQGPAPAPRRLSLLISPVHLVMPIVELTGELRLGPKLGVALIAGAGSVRADDDRTDFKAWELGAQADYYALGTFRHGMQVGVEVLYLGLLDQEPGLTASGAGLAIGPFVGYKLITGIGFTLAVQAGAQVLAVRADVEQGGSSGSMDDQSVIALVNLNLGWSF